MTPREVQLSERPGDSPHGASPSDRRRLQDLALGVDEKRVRALTDAARRHPEDTSLFLEYRLALRIQADVRREDTATESAVSTAKEAILSTAERTRHLRSLLRNEGLWV